jgi:hypothetical protein
MKLYSNLQSKTLKTYTEQDKQIAWDDLNFYVLRNTHFNHTLKIPINRDGKITCYPDEIASFKPLVLAQEVDVFGAPPNESTIIKRKAKEALDCILGNISLNPFCVGGTLH